MESKSPNTTEPENSSAETPASKDSGLTSKDSELTKKSSKTTKGGIREAPHTGLAYQILSARIPPGK